MVFLKDLKKKREKKVNLEIQQTTNKHGNYPVCNELTCLYFSIDSIAAYLNDFDDFKRKHKRSYAEEFATIKNHVDSLESQIAQFEGEINHEQITSCKQVGK